MGGAGCEGERQDFSVCAVVKRSSVTGFTWGFIFWLAEIVRAQLPDSRETCWRGSGLVRNRFGAPVGYRKNCIRKEFANDSECASLRQTGKDGKYAANCSIKEDGHRSDVAWGG